jgi:hypothetical protein
MLMAQMTPGVDYYPAPLSLQQLGPSSPHMMEVAAQMETGATSVKQHRRSASLDTSAEDHQAATASRPSRGTTWRGPRRKSDGR